MTTLAHHDAAQDDGRDDRHDARHDPGPPAPRLHRLRRAGVDLVLSVPATGLPEVLHWGPDLGDLGDGAELRAALGRTVSSSALDEPWPLTVLPGEHDGWAGRPGLAGSRDGRLLLPAWGPTQVVAGDGVLELTGTADGLALRTRLQLDAAGVLRVRHELENTGATAVDVAALEATVPVGDAATELLDLAGRWTRERSPQRRPLTQGSHARETRRGRTGHDAPTLLVAGTPGFGSGHGEVWAVHLAWSADAVYRVDALPEAPTVLGAGVLLRPGEVRLAPGERLRTPDVVFVWSDAGLDGLGDRLHASLRARPGHPRGDRPVTLNTWEAVYFRHDLPALTRLAEVAAEVGVERFVLDDGWFHGRRDDRRGLGDWWTDAGVWPDGLAPLARVVHGLGMELGLWVEPEMVNPDSDLARAHPDWLLHPAGAPGRTWRHQHVLDVARPEVAAYLLEAISAVVTASGVGYLKWDQNRDLLEAVHDGRAGVVRHTEAVYALIDAVRERHPGLEVESCASGGARVDLGILERTDRVWASDTNDPLERLEIQRWTELLVPPELIGSHVGPERAHTTRRVSDLGLRIAVALVGSAGVEWDITGCSPAELEQLRSGIAAYRRLRGLLHTGAVRHPEQPDPGLHVTQVVAPDGSAAVVRVARTTTGPRALPTVLRVPGLDAASRYRVRPVPELAVPAALDVQPPPWLARGEVHLAGAALAGAGVRLPLLAPGQALVLEVTRAD
ncbi:alpha-galactosidase [Cellulomonas sp. P4]|uniref:alpha-galactosidase n=1 Tax=Cellulomonas sp. P4 TaxID=3142533 RepID=UPI0031BBCE00